MPEYTHDKYGTCELAEINHKQLVDYSTAMKGKGDMSLIEWRGESVKAAIRNGFFLSPKLTEQEIDGLGAGYVIWLSDGCIAKMIKEVTDINPLSSSPPQTTQKAK
jgi:hypothetical protein